MGPRILTAQQISAYIDGALSPDEMREVRFQAESYEPSKRLLEASIEAHEAMKSLISQVKSDPAIERFHDMVMLHDFAEDQSTSAPKNELEALLDSSPDRSELMRLLYEITYLGKGRNNIIEMLRRELRLMGPMSDRDDLGIMASSAPPRAMSLDEEWSLSDSELSPKSKQPHLIDQIEKILEIAAEYSAIAELHAELEGAKGAAGFESLLDYCSACLSQVELEDEEKVSQTINQLLISLRRANHPLSTLIRKVFAGTPAGISDYQMLLETYMTMVQRKSKN
jgi:hypothetical protein